ncbi:MAG: hypothetical protein RL329_2517 [Bacteroidota bacterium]|jgi:hypothetical protein
MARDIFPQLEGILIFKTHELLIERLNLKRISKRAPSFKPIQVNLLLFNYLHFDSLFLSNFRFGNF